MRVTSTTTVFQDPDPHSPHRNCAAPSLLRCPDGTLLLAHRVGSTKNSADGKQFLWRSDDDGDTWHRLPFPEHHLDVPGITEQRTAALSCIGDDSVAMLLTWIQHPDDGRPLLNPATEGLLPVSIGWTASRDLGATWSVPRPIPVAPLEQPCGNGGLVRLAGGRLLAGFETYKHYEDARPWSACSCLVASDDDGRTWSAPVVIAQDPRQRKCFWDHHMTVLPGGTLLDSIFVDDRDRPGSSEIYAAESQDGGRTWSEPVPLGIAGQFSVVLPLADGPLALFYVLRSGEPSIRVRLGGGDGRSWEREDAGVVYSQMRDDLGRKGGFTEYLSGMGQWTFGWPSPVRLDGGAVLVAYYQGTPEQTGIYVALGEI